MIVFTNVRHEPFQIDRSDWFAVSRYAWHIDKDGYPTSVGGE